MFFLRWVFDPGLMWKARDHDTILQLMKQLEKILGLNSSDTYAYGL